MPGRCTGLADCVDRPASVEKRHEGGGGGNDRRLRPRRRVHVATSN